MKKSSIFWISVGVVGFVVLVLVATHFAMTHFFEGEWARAGQYGDMFGVAEAIFSGLALTAAAVALWYQGAEVKATLSDIADNQREHKQAAELQALASLIDALDAERGREPENTYLYRGRSYPTSELRTLLMETLIRDYEQIASSRAERERSSRS